MTAVLDLTSLSTLTSAAARCGINLTSVLAELNFRIEAENAPFSQLPLADVSRLVIALEERATEAHFPFAFGDVFHFDGQPAVSAFLASANHLRDAGSLLDWIPELIHPAIRFDGIDNGQQATLNIYVDDDSEVLTNQPTLIETIAAVVSRLIRIIAPGSDVFSRLQLAHSARKAETDYEQYFGCPVEFGGKTNRFILNSHALDSILPGSLPPAHAQAEQTIRLKLVGDGMAPPVSIMLQDLLKQRLELFSEGVPAVAEALKIHPRTLQRRLREEGHSYSALLSRTRHELATEMLRDTTLDIESIGFKLGFSERRSFTQAFQKWQGQTPSSYRKNLSKS